MTMAIDFDVRKLGVGAEVGDFETVALKQSASDLPHRSVRQSAEDSVIATRTFRLASGAPAVDRIT